MFKFRGLDYWTKEARTGFYAEDENGANIIEGRKWYVVDPKSVRQMVGTDIDGKEVFEGDTLENFHGDMFAVSIHHFPSSVQYLRRISNVVVK